MNTSPTTKIAPHSNPQYQAFIDINFYLNSFNLHLNDRDRLMYIVFNTLLK